MTLVKQLGIDQNDLVIKVSQMNLDFDLGIKDFNNLTRTQYDIVRSALDVKYMVKMFKGGKVGVKYNYMNTAFFADVDDWMTGKEFNCKSSKEIKEMLPEHLRKISSQALAAILKSNGHFVKIVYLDTKKQGRRWFKKRDEQPSPSFM